MIIESTSDTKLELLELILTRRSVGKVLPDPVPRELVEQLLAAAVEAPNHKLTLPWRFWVLAGGARDALGELMAAAVAKGLTDPESDVGRVQIAAARSKALRAPVLVVVGVMHETEDPAVRWENVLAGAAAIENLLLAAHALGLGAMWRTGVFAYDPEVKAHFGLARDDDLIGFVYVGRPAIEPAAQLREFETRTEWRGWE